MPGHTVTVGIPECRFQDTPTKLEEQAGDTAQQSGARTAPSEDWSLVPSAPVGSPSLVNPSSKDLMASSGLHGHLYPHEHAHTQTHN